ncbi:hypothetical protein ACTXT7_015899 [Hymenolepis weldensis]
MKTAKRDGRRNEYILCQIELKEKLANRDNIKICNNKVEVKQEKRKLEKQVNQASSNLQIYQSNDLPVNIFLVQMPEWQHGAFQPSFMNCLAYVST